MKVEVEVEMHKLLSLRCIDEPRYGIFLVHFAVMDRPAIVSPPRVQRGGGGRCVVWDMRYVVCRVRRAAWGMQDEACAVRHGAVHVAEFAQAGQFEI